MQVYLVGGAVRDRLLGVPHEERDFVVVGATPEMLAAQGYRPVGRDFPVFLHPETGEEYALARTERKTARGYHGFAFNTSPDVTLEQDLARRDLTINAMAETADGRVIDPYQGRRDLEQRILRHVSPSFAEDPVRLLRVARFVAQLAPFEFRIAPETEALMRTLVADGEVAALVPERVWGECYKALCTTAPVRFFEVLRRTGALPIVLPELSALFQPVAEESKPKSTSDSASGTAVAEAQSRLGINVDRNHKSSAAIPPANCADTNQSSTLDPNHSSSPDARSASDQNSISAARPDTHHHSNHGIAQCTSPGSRSLDALAAAAALTTDPEIRFAALVHALGATDPLPEQAAGKLPAMQVERHPPIVTIAEAAQAPRCTLASRVPDPHREQGVRHIRELSQRLRVPNRFRDLAIKVRRYYRDLDALLFTDPEAAQAMLEGIDFFRRQECLERFGLAAEAVHRAYVSVPERSGYPPAQALRWAAAAASAVTSDAVVRPGLHGVALGAALRTARIEAIAACAAEERWQRLRTSGLPTLQGGNDRG